jgi:hypothetical protein
MGSGEINISSKPGLRNLLAQRFGEGTDDAEVVPAQTNQVGFGGLFQNGRTTSASSVRHRNLRGPSLQDT